MKLFTPFAVLTIAFLMGTSLASPAHALSSSSNFASDINKNEAGSNEELKTGAFSFTDSYGVSSEYKVYADGVDFSKKAPVIVRLHGDNDYDSRTENARMKTFASNVSTAKNAIVVVPKSPDDKGVSTWWENSERNSRWLVELLDNEIVPAHVNIENTFDFIGYSGGSEFISYELLVNNPNVVNNALLIAGGGAPYWSFKNKATKETLNNVKLSWAVGALDDGSTSSDGFNALKAARKGSNFYKNLGYKNVSFSVIPGKNHYNLDQLSIMNDFILTI